jgi:DNA-binding NtrC family response regulator
LNFQPSNRDYSQLWLAVSEALRVLSRGGEEAEALRDSFQAAADGCGARKALLFLVERREPLRLRTLEVRGAITAEQIKACEEGHSAPGISSTAIRQAIDTGEPVVVQDPRLTADAHHTSAFTDPQENFSVLCAPVHNAADDSVLAVLYFQNSIVGEAYVESDVVWADGYTRAMSQALGYYLESRRREEKLRALLESGPHADGGPEIIGDSFHTQRLRRELHETFIPAANSERPEPILLIGEKGAGKEVVARYIQAHSTRVSGPLVVANAAEITPDLASDRFFGHKRGAFTGAQADEPGLFREAHGGVLFLDEIGYLSRGAQGALLRVLDQRTVQPVGSADQIEVDCLVILATNKDLAAAVRANEFLPDLYDRVMAGHRIQLKPLRERLLDIPPLIEHYRGVYERRLHKRTLGFEPALMRALTTYTWPGNVRELAGVCFKLVSYAVPGARVGRAVLERALPEAAGLAEEEPKPAVEEALTQTSLPFREAVVLYQRDLILSRLEQFGGDVHAARRSLKLPEATLRRYMKILDIHPERATAR